MSAFVRSPGLEPSAPRVSSPLTHSRLLHQPPWETRAGATARASLPVLSGKAFLFFWPFFLFMSRYVMFLI